MAVHLVYSSEFLDLRPLRLRVTDDGFTVPDGRGAPAEVALDWTDRGGFEARLIARLAGPGAMGL